MQSVQSRLTEFGEARPLTLGRNSSVDALLVVAQHALDAGNEAHASNIISGLEAQAAYYRTAASAGCLLDVHIDRTRASHESLNLKMKLQHERDYGSATPSDDGRYAANQTGQKRRRW